MWQCKHSKKGFVTYNSFQGSKEKLYSCQHCGVIVSEIADPEEAETYFREREVEA